MNNPFFGFSEKILDYVAKKIMASDNILAYARGEQPMSAHEKKEALEIVKLNV